MLMIVIELDVPMAQLHMLWVAGKRLRSEYFPVEKIRRLVARSERTSAAKGKVWRQYVKFRLIDGWVEDILLQMRNMAEAAGEGYLDLMRRRVIAVLDDVEQAANEVRCEEGAMLAWTLYRG